ncbi:hypothetical protein B1A87_002130 [Arthrobacter sp. KBS0703]|uniref:hypothetical protein n=1 Tax=Arthrobacter sp. KBS0703 TaxID=1955698 RepID=UPI001185112A|nr:hypothetical protein [Arthrobacter sp. KBS0703]TSE14893.1 hypothetical protein B1A87_002130 [Arthrobacter sp. KBS0703]
MYKRQPPAARAEAPAPARAEPKAVHPGPPAPAGQPRLPAGGPLRLPPAALPAYPSVPARDEAQVLADRQALRARREQQNINVTLYIASLLLVAAGALFIGAGLPVPLRFAGACTIMALFYAAGLVLHAKAPRLKPAAVAFSGTGLALIPVTGLAMFSLAVHNGPLSWLVTSVVGTAAYVLAAVRLESRVLVYLSMTIVVSTAWSGVSVLGGALLWYFTALIGVAVCFTVLAIHRPKWVPPVYVRPLAELHPFIVPAVAVAATLVPLVLGRGDYARIMAMCGCYFVVISMMPGAMFRRPQFIAARASLTLAAAAAVWELTDRGSAAIAAAVVALSVQVLLAALAAGRLPARLAGLVHHRGWRLDTLITFGLQLLLTVVLALAQRQDDFFGHAPAAGSLPLWAPALLALATGGVLAWKLRGEAEWAPAAALVMGGLLADWLGAWQLTGLLLAGAAFWAVRALPAAEVLRHHFVLAARVTVTLAAPVLTAAVVGEDNDARSSYGVLALCLVLALQQLATAVLIRTRMRTLTPETSLACFTGAGVAAMTVLTLGHQESFPTPIGDGHLAGTAIAAQLVTSLAVGLLLFPRLEAGQPWRLSVAEAVPLAVAAVAAPLAFDAVSFGLGNAMLLLVTAYVAATAARTSRPVPRRCYWWMSRASATVLTLTVFHQVQQVGGPVLVGGEALAPVTVLAVALVLQLIVPLREGWRGPVPRHVFADAAAVLALQAAAVMIAELSSRAAGSEAAWSWQVTFTTLLLAGGAAAAGYILRAHPWAVAFAPSAFAVLLLLRRESLPGIEMLLGIFAAFSAVMVAAVQDRLLRGGYFAAARVLTAALAVVLSYDVSASPTVVAVTFALVFAAQHVIRWLMRHRLAEVPFQQAAVWVTLAGQTALPLAYVARPFGAGSGADDGGRWVLLLTLLLLLLSVAAAGRLFAARGAVYLGLYAALFAVVALGPLLRFPASGDPTVLLSAPVLSHEGVAVLLLGLSVAATASGILRRDRNTGGVDRWLWLAAAGSFGTSSAMLAPPAADWIAGAAVVGLAAACFAASHVEGLPGFYVPAVLAALAGATMTVDEIFADVSGPWGFYLPWLAGCGTAAAALYSAELARRALQAPAGRPAPARSAQDPSTESGRDVRSLSLVAAAVPGLAVAGLAGLAYSATSWAGAALVAMAAVVIWLEVPVRARRLAAELGSLAVTAAVQRAALFGGALPAGPAELNGNRFDASFWPHSSWPDPFWTAQWYVVLAAVLGVLRYRAGLHDGGRLYQGLAAGLLSVSGVLVIFGGDAAQQLWVLAFFAALLVVGLGYGERMLVWWGAAGVTLCIMWAMRQYTYVLLALIAVGLIALAIWRLSRSRPAGTE